MPPSTARTYLVGKLGSYEVPTLARVDSHLRELRHRLNAAGPQMLPRIWADINLLLEHRHRLEKPCPSATSSDGSSAPS